MRRGYNELATAEHVSTPSEALDALTFEVDRRTKSSEQVEAGFCFRGRRLSAEPWLGVPWPILDPPDVPQLTREARDAHYEDLPDARPGETFHWQAYPPDEKAYEEFVRYALRRASQLDREEGPSVPFVSGLESGLDVRTTIRFWHEDQVYVRQHLRGSESIRNGAIDWTSRAEDSRSWAASAVGRSGAGWNDPDSTVIGCVSRVVGHETISTQGQSEVTRRPREWSFVTLDHPVLETRPGSGALWERVIMPLVDLQEGPRDNVYGWLELVFQFCEGKPFAYYSQVSCRALASTRWRGHTRCACDGVRSANCPPHSSRAIASGTSSG